MARPIETSPRNGKLVFVGDDHGLIDAAFWHEPALPGAAGYWAHALPDGSATPILFTPTRWGESTDEFERD